MLPVRVPIVQKVYTEPPKDFRSDFPLPAFSRLYIQLESMTAMENVHPLVYARKELGYCSFLLIGNREDVS